MSSSRPRDLPDEDAWQFRDMLMSRTQTTMPLVLTVDVCDNCGYPVPGPCGGTGAICTNCGWKKDCS